MLFNLKNTGSKGERNTSSKGDKNTGSCILIAQREKGTIM
uniref:Uncharacterized protein n=1 Tax=Arundo donax TaxID=35708 RepID=A0A0A9ANA6_ARUDO